MRARWVTVKYDPPMTRPVTAPPSEAKNEEKRYKLAIFLVHLHMTPLKSRHPLLEI